MALADRTEICPPQSRAKDPQQEQGAPTASPDDSFYSAVADEIDQQKLDRVLWTRAVADSEGDEKRAKSFYIRYRVRALQAEAGRRVQAQHEAEVLGREKAKREAPSPEQNGCFYSFMIALGIAVVIAVVSNLRESARENTPPTPLLESSRPAPYPRMDAAPQQPLSVAEEFAALRDEFARLAAKRAFLNQDNVREVQEFNREAAAYSERLKKVRERNAPQTR